MKNLPHFICNFDPLQQIDELVKKYTNISHYFEMIRNAKTNSHLPSDIWMQWLVITNACKKICLASILLSTLWMPSFSGNSQSALWIYTFSGFVLTDTLRNDATATGNCSLCLLLKYFMGWMSIYVLHSFISKMKRKLQNIFCT